MAEETSPAEVKMDRVITEVPPPPMFPLPLSELKNEDGTINIPILKNYLLREGRLSTEAANYLVDTASALFAEEPNVMNIKYPLTVCGDVHGQFFDLVKLFEVGGNPEETQFLFLGDYVDRGCFSTECVFYLYAHKIMYPDRFFMLRGNHECRQLTSFFNFKDECTYKYDEDLYDRIMSSFDHLPLAALVNDSFFCVHGGLSPDINTIDQIADIDRFHEVPREGPFCDLLWSDPYEDEDADELDDGEEGENSWFGYNDTRQCSYVFGVEAVKSFLDENKITSVVRAHEAQVNGYKMMMMNKATGIPRVITIFSAPNYCDVYKNKAACLKFDNGSLNIKQFVESEHPYYLPNFMDVFQWSLPFVAEKVTDILEWIMDDDESSDEDDQKDDLDNLTRPHVEPGKLKKKVLAVSKILRMYRVLRQNSEAIVTLKQLTSSHKVPLGLLQAGPEAIKQAVSDFENAKKADSVNEQYPSFPDNKTDPARFQFRHRKNSEAILRRSPRRSRTGSRARKVKAVAKVPEKQAEKDNSVATDVIAE